MNELAPSSLQEKAKGGKGSTGKSHVDNAFAFLAGACEAILIWASAFRHLLA